MVLVKLLSSSCVRVVFYISFFKFKYYLVFTGAFVDADCPICLFIAASKISRFIFLERKHDLIVL